MMFSFVVSFIARSLGSEAQCELTPMNVLYIDLANTIPVN